MIEVDPSKIVLLEIDALRLNPNNRNKHPADQIDRLAKLIKAHGFRQPILVSERSGYVVAGHGRLEAARKLGLKQVPVMFQAFESDEAEYAFGVSDNAIAAWAELDLSGINADLASLGPDFDIDLLGIKDFVLEPIEKLDPQCDEDEVPDALPEAKVVRGEVYVLGNHRLMCGDSTNVQHVETLLDGQRADMVFTDPPYGIAYSSSKFDGNKGGVTNKRNKADMIIGDADDYDPSFILGLFDYCKEIFVWGFQYYPHRLGRGGVIVWNKKNEREQDNPHGDFELCWSKSERNKMFWYRWGGFRNKEKGEERLHTTQKPVALAEWFFENWGNGKTRIVDLFGGSGSTLIACEKTDRQCFMMELDPHYCGVILDRWQKFTGKKAHREDGVAWDDIKAGTIDG